VNRSLLFPVILIVVVDVLGFTIVLPLLPFYAEHFGASAAEVGALTSIYAAGSLVAGPILGRWSDRLGRRPVLLISQAGTCLGFLVMAFAPSLAWIFAGRIIAGLTSGNLAVAQATIADRTPPEQRTRAFGLIGAAFGLGFLVGPAISGILVKIALTAPILAAAALSLVSIGCTLSLIPRKTRAEGVMETPMPTRGQLLADPQLRRRLILFFGFVLGFSTFIAGLALYCQRRLTWNGHPFGASEVSFVFAAVGLWGLIIQLRLLKPLLARFGEARLIVIGFLAVAIGYALLAPAGGLWLFAASALIGGLGSGITRPSLMGLISQAAPPEAQGVVIGITSSLQSMAMIVGGVLAGSLIHAGWLAGWSLTVAGFAAASALLALKPAPQPVSPDTQR